MKSFLEWFKGSTKIKRWIFLIIIGIALTCYSFAKILVTKEIDFVTLAKVIGLFVVGFLCIVLGIIYIQRRLLELIIEANDSDSEKGKAAKVNIQSLIFNKKVYEEGPKIVVIGGGFGLNNVIEGLKKYTNNILNFNNPRDAFAVTQFMLGIDLNTTNQSDWQRAALKLKEQKPIIQSYAMDEVYDKMEGEQAAIAAYYAGDCMQMIESNPNLAFVYPKEGTNIFVDSICIPKASKNLEAAKLYINYLLEPDIALANAEKLCYASPNTAVVNNENYSYKDSEILYPNEEQMPKTEYFHDLTPTVRSYYESLWTEVKNS